MNPTFEIHYFLKDNSHSMDARLKNQCELELLSVAYELIEIFDMDISINVEALKEGGVKELLNFRWSDFSRTDKIAAIGCLCLVLQTIQTFYNSYTSLSPIKESLELQEKKESIETHNLTQEKLNLEIAQMKKDAESGIINDENIEYISKQIIENNHKIKKRRSNFYKKLIHSCQAP